MPLIETTDTHIITNVNNKKIIAIDKKTGKVGVAKLNDEDKFDLEFGKALAIVRTVSSREADRLISKYYGSKLYDFSGNKIEYNVSYLNMKTNKVYRFELCKHNNKTIFYTIIGKFYTIENLVKFQYCKYDFFQELSYDTKKALFKENNSVFIKLDKYSLEKSESEKIIIRS